MEAAWLKEGGLFIFYFCIKKGVGEGLKIEGDKYRNYCATIPNSSPFPNMLQERGQLQGLKHGL